MIVLDTHAAFWLNSAPEKLSKAAARAIRRSAADGEIFMASISLWELAMHIERGWIRLRTASARDYLADLVKTPGLTLVEITAEIAALATQLPRDFPSDPADRLITGTALALGASLVTRDERIQNSRLLRTIW